MITVGTRLKLIAFLLIGVSIIAYVGVKYANLGRLVGARGYYVVTLDLADSGGIFTNAEVTYRGVTVGRVGPLSLTPDGMSAELDIDDSAPRIPANLQAAIADRSAVGEQYVDLRPKSAAGPYLTDGATIPESETVLPIPVQNVLQNLDSLAASVPTQSLQTVVDQLYDATNGQGPNLQVLLDTSSTLATAATTDLPDTRQLLANSQTVLATQSDETSALESFGSNADLLAQQLASSDSDLRRLIVATPQALTQLSGVIQDTDPALSVLLANLLTTSEVTVTRQNGIQELLAVAPTLVQDGSTAFAGGVAHVGLSLTFFDPLPCTKGYGGTTYRNGLDTSAQQPLNTAASCAEPASTGIDVRGSANAPDSHTPVPAAVTPGSANVAQADPLNLSDSGTTVPQLLGLTTP